MSPAATATPAIPRPRQHDEGFRVQVGDRYAVAGRLMEVTRVVAPVRCYMKPVAPTRRPIPPVMPLMLVAGPKAIYPLRRRCA